MSCFCSFLKWKSSSDQKLCDANGGKKPCCDWGGQKRSTFSAPEGIGFNRNHRIQNQRRIGNDMMQGPLCIIKSGPLILNLAVPVETGPLWSRKSALEDLVPAIATPAKRFLQKYIEKIGNTRAYSYKELRKATSNFSDKIGEGGFGSVYKGRLKDGKNVAVKVLSTDSRQGIKEFFTEVQVISGIVHENLVRLYGCCMEGDHRILVYNYLENNSLAQTLLGSKSSGQSNIHFNWRTRVKICIGIAKGLAYLHEEVHPHIVHRDIKASNILLDRNLNPRISDFGLARLLPPNTTHVSTRVAGTFGYLAPEYAIRGQVTRKSDVYSFGVLLLEIVTGRSNTNMKLSYDDQILLEKTWSFFQNGELEKLIDPSLEEDLNKDEACRFLTVGLLCTQDITKLRPTMSAALRMLTGEMDVNSKEISKPAVIQDLMQVKLNGERPSISTLAVASSSDESTRVSLTFTAISERD